MGPMREVLWTECPVLANYISEEWWQLSVTILTQRMSSPYLPIEFGFLLSCAENWKLKSGKAFSEKGWRD